MCGGWNWPASRAAWRCQVTSHKTETNKRYAITSESDITDGFGRLSERGCASDTTRAQMPENEHAKYDMTSLHAYFDESERPDGQFVVAACIFCARKARRFRREWEPIFRPYGGLHYVDLVHKRRRFASISDEERDSLIRSAIPIVRDSTEACVVITGRTEDAKALRIEADGFRTAYAICCRFAAIRIDEWCKGEGRKQSVNFVFESGHRAQNEVDRFFSAVAKDERASREFRYAGHSFEKKGKNPLLEAADLLAWEFGKFKTDQLDREGDPARRPVRGSLASLVLGHGKKFMLHALTFDGLKRERESFIREGVLVPKEEKPVGDCREG